MSDALSQATTGGGRPLPDRVVVACTATLHGIGVLRLPDRLDADGSIGAFLVESASSARDLFREIDMAGRKVFVDVERKQAVDLPALAQECVRNAEIYPHKPNDATVRSLDVLVTHLVGFDLSGLTVGVTGTGNIGFKAALLLAERGANVVVHGRDSRNAHRTVAAIRAIVPRFSTNDVAIWEEQKADLLVTALAARGVIDSGWVSRLESRARVIDIGIGNLSADFVGHALAAGMQILRLDTRTTGCQLVAPAPAFFQEFFGQAEVDGVRIASGGIIGTRGTVVVDSYARPRRILGIADGLGGLVPSSSITRPESGALEIVKAHFHLHEAKH